MIKVILCDGPEDLIALLKIINLYEQSGKPIDVGNISSQQSDAIVAGEVALGTPTQQTDDTGTVRINRRRRDPTIPKRKYTRRASLVSDTTDPPTVIAGGTSAVGDSMTDGESIGDTTTTDTPVTAADAVEGSNEDAQTPAADGTTPPLTLATEDVVAAASVILTEGDALVVTGTTDAEASTVAVPDDTTDAPSVASDKGEEFVAINNYTDEEPIISTVDPSDPTLVEHYASMNPRELVHARNDLTFKLKGLTPGTPEYTHTEVLLTIINANF